MEDDNSLFGNLFRFIYVVLIIYGQIFGIAHSVRFHSRTDTIVSIIIPPWAWYRSAELFWHDENDVTNRQLRKDLRACIKLINNSLDPEITDKDVESELNTIKDRIKNYPLKRKEYLYEGTFNSLVFTFSIMIDSKQAFENYLKYGTFRFITSQQTKNSERILKKKFKMGEKTDATINVVKLECQEILNDISSEGFPLPFEKKEKLESYITTLDNQFGEIGKDELKVMESLFDDIKQLNNNDLKASK